MPLSSQLVKYTDGTIKHFRRIHEIKPCGERCNGCVTAIGSKICFNSKNKQKEGMDPNVHICIAYTNDQQLQLKLDFIEPFRTRDYLIKYVHQVMRKENIY